MTAPRSKISPPQTPHGSARSSAPARQASRTGQSRAEALGQLQLRRALGEPQVGVLHPAGQRTPDRGAGATRCAVASVLRDPPVQGSPGRRWDAGGRSSAALPLLLFSVCDGRRGPADRWSGPGAAERRKAADPGVRVPRPRGGPVERLALWSPRGGDPEGGAVVLGEVGGRERGAAARRARRARQPDGRAQRCRRWRPCRRRLSNALTPTRQPSAAHGEATQAEECRRGRRSTDVLVIGPPPLGADPGRAAGIERGVQLVCDGTLGPPRPRVNRIIRRFLRTWSPTFRNRPPSPFAVSR